MEKNIILLCDGTSNQITEDRTNILRLYGCLKKSDDQIVFYDPGVGTFGAQDSPFQIKRKSTEFFGLATGWGLDKNVKEAYRFLVEHYEHGEKGGDGERESDRIILYGFSRGAYTVRVLAGFIHTIGLMKPENLNLLDYAYRAYKRIGDDQDQQKDQDSSAAFSEVRLYERTLDTVRPTIHFLGLFDTVASVIETNGAGARLKSHAFTSNNLSVARVRHAVAIDERRTMFQPLLWGQQRRYREHYWKKSSEGAQSVSEVWFKGSHGDIGGGYPEKKSALAKFPLLWMIEESKKSDIAFNTATVNKIVKGQNPKSAKRLYVKPDACAKVNDSMRGLWSALEYIPRRKSQYIETNRKSLWGWFVPRKERRVIPMGANIHSSVFECSATDPDKQHPNLPKVST